MYTGLQLLSFASQGETGMTLNSAAATVLLFHYLVSDFSACV